MKTVVHVELPDLRPNRALLVGMTTVHSTLTQARTDLIQEVVAPPIPPPRLTATAAVSAKLTGVNLKPPLRWFFYVFIFTKPTSQTAPCQR